jgi:hypothetical protein
VRRQLAREQPRADDLVDRVVPPDVLAHDHERARGVEQRGGVQPAGAREHGLRVAQRARERVHERRVEEQAASAGAATSRAGRSASATSCRTRRTPTSSRRRGRVRRGRRARAA